MEDDPTPTNATTSAATNANQCQPTAGLESVSVISNWLKPDGTASSRHAATSSLSPAALHQKATIAADSCRPPVSAAPIDGDRVHSALSKTQQRDTQAGSTRQEEAPASTRGWGGGPGVLAALLVVHPKRPANERPASLLRSPQPPQLVRPWCIRLQGLPTEAAVCFASDADTAAPNQEAYGGHDPRSWQLTTAARMSAVLIFEVL